MVKVAITGYGAVTPVGLTARESLKNVWHGRSGITQLPEELTSGIPIKIGGIAKSGTKHFDAQTLVDEKYLKRGDITRLDSHALLAITAGIEAIKAALPEAGMGLAELAVNKHRFGVSLGTSAGPVGLFQKATRSLDSEGPRKVSPGVVVYGGSDAAAAYLSVLLGTTGTTVGFGATCASGALALGEALRSIRHGYLDAVLVIGADDCLNRVNLAANAAIRSLTVQHSTEPEKASRPFDKNRSGFVMSQGAAAILLENADIAKTRNAKIHGYLLGYGTTSDAHHATAPHPEGLGAAAAMNEAVRDAKITKSQIGHINAHGTSTVQGDTAEVMAIKQVFGAQVNSANQVPTVTATKSVTGHMLGAAGVFEAIVSLHSLATKQIPPTINLTSNDFDIDIVTQTRPTEAEYVMSNSFGFGGHNVSLVLGR